MTTKSTAAPAAPATEVLMTKEQLLARIAELEAKVARPVLARSQVNIVIDTNVQCKGGTCAFLTITSNEPDFEDRTVIAKYILNDGRTKTRESGVRSTHFYGDKAKPTAEPEQSF